MKTKLEAFEDLLLEKLTDPNPKPKFNLWQPVSYGIDRPNKETKIVETKIVGFYFVSVGIAFRESSDPGWYYYLESGYEHKIFHEDDLSAI